MDTRSSNPTLGQSTFSNLRYLGDQADVMTSQGTIVKTILLLLVVVLSAGFVWTKFYQAGANPEAVSGWMMLGVFGGFIAAMVTVFKKEGRQLQLRFTRF